MSCGSGPTRPAGMLRAAGRYTSQLDPSAIDGDHLRLLQSTQPHAPLTQRAVAYHSGMTPSAIHIAPSPQQRKAVAAGEPAPWHKWQSRAAPSAEAPAPAITQKSKQQPTREREVPLHVHKRNHRGAPPPKSEQLVRALAQVSSTPPQLLSLMRRGDSMVMPGSVPRPVRAGEQPANT